MTEQPTCDWQSLAAEASTEKNSEKLNAIVEKLIQALDAEAGSRPAGNFRSSFAA
jgi:hypothetical protein